MTETSIVIDGITVELVETGAVIVGSGAAGFAAANALYDQGICDVAVITEHIYCGTSRNTGSDKQTYYKLNLCGSNSDSVRQMADTLYSGGGMDGELALAEAAGSAECFLELARLGVPFPRNRYGEYVGYKTDHDPVQRASSAGPLTSKMMTEALQKEVERKHICIYSGWQAIRILHDNEKIWGVLCLGVGENAGRANKDEIEQMRFRIFCAANIVWATGGPAGIYHNSVYPHGQHGASGIAYLAGVKGRNLTEWQYGIASIKPRWNVSGTYMQVLPRVISAEQDGSKEREFLEEYFPSKQEALCQLFLKGYQWPFDVRKSVNGSSQIDLAVYNETVQKKRRVFLDFRKNPWNKTCESWELTEEADTYLKNAGAWFGTPIERLSHMNMPAVEFYKSKGVDLRTEPLEIALCAQHNNGGIAVDLWWRTNLEGLFAVGEAAGTHGIYRPGGSALNSGQVGAKRAALYIASKGKKERPGNMPQRCILQVREVLELALASGVARGERTAEEWMLIFQKKMSETAGPVRFPEKILELKKENEEILCRFKEKVKVGKSGIKGVFQLEDMLLAQRMYLSAMADYIENGEGDRGSALYQEEIGFDKKEHSRKNLEHKGEIQEIWLDKDKKVQVVWRKPHPIPKETCFFEEVWRHYRKDQNIY